MRKYWFLIVVIVGVIIVASLLFQYFNYVEATIYISTSGVFRQEGLKININGKEYPVEDWKVFIPKIKKGTYNIEILFNNEKILEEKQPFSKKLTELTISLPKPPEIVSADYSYDENKRVLTLKWKVSGDIKPDRFEVFKDGKSVLNTVKKEFTEDFGPFESHLYEIRPLFLNNVYGVSYKVEVGPFKEPAHLIGRVVVPFNVEAQRIKIEFDDRKTMLDQDYTFDIKNVIPGSYTFRILIDDEEILTRTSTIASGENELLLELPSLPEIKQATAIVDTSAKKIKISWSEAKDNYYKPKFYDVEDSKGNIYKTETNKIELPWESSEATYNIIPIFFKGISGDAYTLYKPPAPHFEISVPRKYNRNILKIKLPSEKDIEFLVKIDDGNWMKLENNELKLTDGEHRLFIKAVDNWNQTSESSYTVFVDSTPPLPPMDLNVKYEEGELIVSWLPSISEDVKRHFVELSIDAPISYESTNLIVYDVKKLETIPDTLQVSVIAEDYYGNRSQRTIKVVVPKVPNLIKKEVKFLNDGNDVSIKMEFSDLSGRIHLYLNNKEIRVSDSNRVAIHLKSLDFDKRYMLSAQVENSFGRSSRVKLLEFMTPLPKPEIVEIRQTGINEVFLKIKAEGDYFEYSVNSPDFSMILQSREKEKLVVLPQAGKYSFSVKAFTYHNQSLASDPVEFSVIPAQSELPNVIDRKIVVSKEGGPYLITKDIRITEEGELILGKGVELIFSENSTVQVYGKLFVNNLKITLMEGTEWKGIKIHKNGYVEIRGLEFSKLSPLVETDGGSVLIVSSKFEDMGKSIKISGGSLTIENSEFESVANPIIAVESDVKILSSRLSDYDLAVSLESGKLNLREVRFTDGMSALKVTNSSMTASNLLFSKNIVGLESINSHIYLKECEFNSNVKGVLSIDSILTVVDSLLRNNLRAAESHVSSTKIPEYEMVVYNKTGKLIDAPVRFFYDEFRSNNVDIYAADGSYPILLRACRGIEKIYDFNVSPFYRDRAGVLHKRSEVIYDLPDNIKFRLIDENQISIPILKDGLRILDENGRELDFSIQRMVKPETGLPNDLKVIFLVDLSDSIVDQTGEDLKEYETIIDKIRDHFKNIEIYVFNSNWVRRVNKDWIVKKIEVWGYTPLYDTILTILNSQTVDEGPYGIVVLTDGLDSDWKDEKNGSINDVQRLVDISERRNIPIAMVIYGESNIFRNPFPHVNKDFEKLSSSSQIGIFDWRRKDLLERIEEKFEESYSLEYVITLKDIPVSSKVRLKIQKRLSTFNRIIRIPYYPIETNRSCKLKEVEFSSEITKDLLDRNITLLTIDF